MPVTTRSRSRRQKKQQEQAGAEGSQQSEETKTPRRSARIAAKRARDSVTPGASEEGKSVSSTPDDAGGVQRAFDYLRNAGGAADNYISNPTSRPQFGITLRSDTLDHPMKFIVPNHEPQSTAEIRQQIRQFTESPVTLKNKDKQNKNSIGKRKRKNDKSSKNKKNKSSKNSKNKSKSKNKNSENDSEVETDYSDSNNESESESNDKNNSGNSKNSQSLLSPNRYQLTSEPSRVPTFNHDSQQWSFEPEEEMPTVARNLLMFIVGLIVVVLAVVYRDQLLDIYQGNMPSIPSVISDLGTQGTDFVSNLWSNAGGSSGATETATETASEEASTEATEETSDATTEAATETTSETTTEPVNDAADDGANAAAGDAAGDAASDSAAETSSEAASDDAATTETA